MRRWLLDDTVVERAWVADEIAASERLFGAQGCGLWAVRPLAPTAAPARVIVGFAGFRPFFDPPELQLLYGLVPGAWGRGYATEAAAAVTTYALESLGFEEVRAATDLPNEASIRVLERLGMRELSRTDDGPEGTVFYRLGR